MTPPHMEAVLARLHQDQTIATFSLAWGKGPIRALVETTYDDLEAVTLAPVQYDQHMATWSKSTPRWHVRTADIALIIES